MAYSSTDLLRATTHADDCWSWGPGHYKCAVERVIRDEALMKRALEALESAVAEIERLREALEEILSRSCMNLAMNPNPYALTALLGDIHQIAGAALAQEGEQ